MPKVCIERPNRTKRRYFSACDAARIARQVVQDDKETTPEEVMACIAKGFGFTHISLSRIRVLESGIAIKPKDAVVILTKALPYLERLALKFPSIAKALVPILAALRKALDYLGKIDVAEPPQAEVEDVINKEKCKCKDNPFQTKEGENDK